MVRLAAHAMHYDGAVWHDEQAVRVVHASVLGDHRRRPGMGGPQLLGNDVRTLDALSRISDDLRGADVDRHAHAHDAPVFRLVQGYGITPGRGHVKNRCPRSVNPRHDAVDDGVERRVNLRIDV